MIYSSVRAWRRTWDGGIQFAIAVKSMVTTATESLYALMVLHWSEDLEHLEKL